MIIGILIVIILALGFAVFNLLRKLEFYEQQIEDFYSRVSIVLHSMRAIDEKKMFESDDEVGNVFQQINDVLGSLRPLLYGLDYDEKN
jgi:hypothetical protein